MWSQIYYWSSNLIIVTSIHRLFRVAIYKTTIGSEGMFGLYLSLSGIFHHSVVQFINGSYPKFLIPISSPNNSFTLPHTLRQQQPQKMMAHLWLTKQQPQPHINYILLIFPRLQLNDMALTTFYSHPKDVWCSSKYLWKGMVLN